MGRLKDLKNINRALKIKIKSLYEEIDVYKTRVKCNNKEIKRILNKDNVD